MIAFMQTDEVHDEINDSERQRDVVPSKDIRCFLMGTLLHIKITADCALRIDKMGKQLVEYDDDIKTDP